MRSAVLALASAALLSSGSHAFKNTSPLLVWSSEPNLALNEASEEISSGVIGADEVYGTIHGLGCEWETLMVVHVDELHNSHLASRSLPTSQKADLSIPYLLRPTRESLDSAVNSWAQLCGAEVVSDVTDNGSGKTVVLLEVSKDHDLSIIPIPDTPHILLLTGTHPPVEKRQERPYVQHPAASATKSSSASRPSSTGSQADRNSTIPTGGPLLQRVQILTTPIITGVLITFLIFLPIIGFGIWSLAGIQVPPRMMEISKGMIVGKDKKDQ